MLASDSNRRQFTANGSATSYPFNALVYDASDMVVIDTDVATGLDTTLVLDTDYTIDPAQLGLDSGIDVDFDVAPLNGHRITLARIVPVIQPIVFPQNSPLPSKSVEKELDRQVMMMQQITDAINRGGLPLSTPIGQTVRASGVDYTFFDQSTGLTARLGVTVGSHRDSTGGRTLVLSMAGDLITGVPQTPLVVGEDDTVVFAHFEVDPATGELSQTVKEILSGEEVPEDDEENTYQKLADILVDVSSGIAVVNVLSGGRGSQNYVYCGNLPATDGSGHQFNS